MKQNNPLTKFLTLKEDRITEEIVSLIWHLKYNRDWRLRKIAIDIFERIGKDAVNPLIEALKDESWWVREVAAISLGKIGDERAVEALIEALKDEDKDVRKQAAIALGKIGDERAVEALIEALKDESEVVRNEVREAILRIDENCANVVEEEEKLEYLLWNLRHNRNWQFRKQAAIALGKIGDERAVEALIEALKDESEVVRNEVQKIIVSTGKVSVDALIEALKDEDKDVRKQAAIALGKIGDENALKYLIPMLKKPEIREEVKSALTEFGEIAVKYLIQATKNDYPKYKKIAIDIFEKIGKDAVNPLIEALKDESWWVREVAAISLGKIGDERAVEALIEALKDEDKDVRKQAAIALNKKI